MALGRRRARRRTMDLLPVRGKRRFIPFLRRQTVGASFDLGAKCEEFLGEVPGFEGVVDVSGEHVDRTPVPVLVQFVLSGSDYFKMFPPVKPSK